MVSLNINNTPVTVSEGTTILEAARAAGVDIPHLCFLKDINEIGACRVCCVEIEGENKLVPSCNNVVAEGMQVRTNSPRVRQARRRNLELILSQHDTNCAVCVRNGSCQLQKLSKELNIYDDFYEKNLPNKRQRQWSDSFALVRDAAKCIKCMRCVQVCDKIQSLGVWDLAGTGSRTRVDTSKNRMISEADCSLCGQCITHCPVGALYAREDTSVVAKALNDPNKIVVAQIAPAVRTAWVESLGLDPEEITVNHLCAALREAGFDYIFDTSFSADLTIMEEGTELLERLKAGDLDEAPMFTSCCPGWVRFLKSQFPEMTDKLSTAKSPQQMFGALIKSYFAEQTGKKPEDIFSVSIMPCSAKKSECDLPTMKPDGVPDVDCVLTTREVVRLIQSNCIDVSSLAPSDFDSLMQAYSGAGVIFGATGGVMEAALRSAHYLVVGENAPAEAFYDVRDTGTGNAVWREAEFDLAGTKVRVAVTSGLRNARALVNAVKSGQANYDFVEIMACPGGCSGGGGQPIHTDDLERAGSRGALLYQLDAANALRYSHENPDILKVYGEYLEAPCSEKAHHLLHTDHFGWDMPKQD